MLLGSQRKFYKVHGLDAAAMKVFSLAAVLSASFCIALGALFFSHAWLLFQNLTSIEVGNFGRNPFCLGFLPNAEQVCGAADMAWILPVPPVHPLTDGLAFPTKELARGRAPVPMAEVVPMSEATGLE